MLNQIVLVGKIQEIRELEKGTIITLIVPQPFKNIDGKYDDNYIDVRIYGNISEITKKYCKKGDLVGVKGRVQKLENNKELEIIADKVTFLSTRKESE